jgi:hypothetical protein
MTLLKTWFTEISILPETISNGGDITSRNEKPTYFNWLKVSPLGFRRTPSGNPVFVESKKISNLILCGSVIFVSVLIVLNRVREGRT